MHRLPWTAAACAGLLIITACGSAAEDPAADGGEREGTGLTVVTSTNVYADLVSRIGDDTVEVKPLVSSTSVDPHSYEATPQDRLAVEGADVIIANGGGYDSFITLLAASAEKEDQVYQLIEGENEHSHESDDAGDKDHSGETDGTHEHDHSHEADDEHDHSHGSDDAGYQNEHIWYDLERMEEFVLDVADHLSELAPENAELYADNAEQLAAEIHQLDERNRALEADGLSFLATEAVSGHLLEDAGFTNRTDLEFLSAVEHGDDVSPRLYHQALQAAEEVDLLSYNSQTETQQSARIRAAAEDSGTAVLEFTETLPEDSTGYVEWMESNIDRLASAAEEIR